MVKFCKALNTWRALDTVGMATTIAVSGIHTQSLTHWLLGFPGARPTLG